MASDDQERNQNQNQNVAETMTYLYPSSDNTVLIPDGNLDDVPYKTGKHSIIKGKKAAPASTEVSDPFAPKTSPAAPADLELSRTPKKKGCVVAFVFAVVFAAVVIAALMVLNPF